MEKEIPPYELALRMKALDYDEPCFGFYDKGELTIEIIKSGKIFTSNPEDSIYFDKDSSCLAPTFSQVFRWFREKYDLNIFVYHYGKDGILNTIYFAYNINDKLYSSDFKAYEEAELACLTKLIEIVENKSK